jgi:hypothetical protein
MLALTILGRAAFGGIFTIFAAIITRIRQRAAARFMPALIRFLCIVHKTLLEDLALQSQCQTYLQSQSNGKCAYVAQAGKRCRLRSRKKKLTANH